MGIGVAGVAMGMGVCSRRRRMVGHSFFWESSPDPYTIFFFHNLRENASKPEFIH
jgi:hypothetical protein